MPPVPPAPVDAVLCQKSAFGVSAKPSAGTGMSSNFADEVADTYIMWIALPDEKYALY
jgi:hypothetical protein